MHNSNLWTKDFLIDSVTNCFLYLSYYLLILTITLYAADQFQASPSEAGLASGIFILGALFARIFAGRSIERVGRKKTLYFGLSFFLLTTLAYFIVNSLPLLLCIRFLNGVGFGVSSTATGTIAASIIPHERRGEGTSYYALSMTFASAVGPFLGMLLSQQGHFQLIFALCAALIGVSFTAAFFLSVPEVALTPEQQARMKEYKLSSFLEARAIPIAFISALTGFAFSGILCFLSAYTREINLVGAGSFFFIVYAAAVLISRPFTGRIFDRRGEDMVMYPAFLLLALGLLILSLADTGPLLLLAGVCAGLGFGTFMSSAQAISVKVSPRHRMGLATSTFFIFLDAGVGVGPFLLGFLIPATGFRGLYASMAAVVMLCIVFYYFLHSRKAPVRNEEPVIEY
ncbi:MAG TPA: MFS transporter [Patescibacteria group bacterium]|nr:MFS transporter [Patescibacteria group bacterium]